MDPTNACDVIMNEMSGPLPRPPTLPYPTLHLDSFQTLSAESFHTPGPPSRSSSGPPPVDPVKHVSDGPPNHSDTSAGRSSALLDAVEPNSRASSRASLRPDANTGAMATLQGSNRSCSPPGHQIKSIQPVLSADLTQAPPFLDQQPLPSPPSMSFPSFPSLPNISPISPLKPPSPASSSFPLTPSSSILDGRITGDVKLLEPGLRSTISPSPRRLGPSLTIHIPGKTPSPSASDEKVVVKESVLPRRRTIIEGSSSPAMKGSPVRLSSLTAQAPSAARPSPPRDLLAPASADATPIAQTTMPISFPQPMIAGSKIVPATTPRKLERKQSTNDLKQSSPVSPTARRSLPRPPKDSLPGQSGRSTSGPTPSKSILMPSQPPVASSSWPPPPAATSTGTNGVRLSAPSFGPPLPKPAMYQNREAKTNGSASSLPIIAGLADAGPYPSSSSRKAVDSRLPQNAVGAGRPQGRKPGPQEEICLECMMRDRDLADVNVVGDGVWERQSDFDFNDLRARELSMSRSLSGFASSSPSIPSVEEGQSSDSESTSASFPSTGNSLEEAEARRCVVARKQAKNALRSQRKALDRRIVEEVGWRGFKWEEGPNGEGLPRRFRGTAGGPLTEEGIKAVMTKFPSASAHRYATLQHFLRQQWDLVVQIRAEAQRVGRYPGPDDPSFAWSASDHDAGAVIAPRTSSIEWDRRPSQRPGGVNVVQPILPYTAPLRPSPSSPAELANLHARPRQAPAQRPTTHFVPETEPLQPINRTPQSGSVGKGRHNKGISSPGLLQSSPRLGDNVPDNDDEPWEPLSPAESGLRPFSFAVRAGAAAARDGSEGHGGRRSLWGRWGGSVTSFFGGSQGGSGSMMDMHLGLEQERRHHNNSQPLLDHPRAVSMASPPRPSFFGRSSRASSIAEPPRERESSRLSKSVSSSRLSQVLQSADLNDDASRRRKKSFAGLFKRLKPKGNRSGGSDKLDNASPRFPQNGVTSDYGGPLQPPPPISYLVGGRGDGQHNRNRSGSSASMLTDSQSQISVGPPGAARYSGRSVSAPFAGSMSGGSESLSPTSSRYGPRRESYASVQGRRQSATITLNEPDEDKRGSIVEILSTGRPQIFSSPEPSQQYEEAKHANGVQGMAPPQPGFRVYNKPASSMSGSSVLAPTLETPPPTISGSPYFSAHAKQGQTTPTAAIPLSPNRFKNLPPLPVPDMSYASSPDSFAAVFPEQERSIPHIAHDPRYSHGSYDSRYHHGNDKPPAQSRTPVQNKLQQPRMAGAAAPDQGRYAYPQPAFHALGPASRASFDTSDRGHLRPYHAPPPQRMATSLYDPALLPLSTDQGGMYGYETPEKGSKGRKGFKALFGSAGRPGRS